ncbi:MAG: hypothetical protein HOG04_05580 [Nitrospinaceae bacterium]|nr:hypothetical protein [Nitrospinaceae bacterium]
MADKSFVGKFFNSGLLGIYLRVIEEGEIGAGDAIERIEAGPEQITVREMARLRNFGEGDLELTRRALRISALAPEIKEQFKIRLEKENQPTKDAE